MLSALKNQTWICKKFCPTSFLRDDNDNFKKRKLPSNELYD